MPALLYGIGAFALFTGLLMIGFGIPINEFSFGNTLIGAGTTASIGGLIIIGLGVVAGQLRRVAETLAMPLPGRPAQPPEVRKVRLHRVRLRPRVGSHFPVGLHRQLSILERQPPIRTRTSSKKFPRPRCAIRTFRKRWRRRLPCRPRVL